MDHFAFPLDDKKDNSLFQLLEILSYSPPISSPTPPNYYEILGVNRDSTKEDIRRAFRKHYGELRLYHPERMTEKQIEKQRENDKKFSAVHEAFEILFNDEKRTLYDSKWDVLYKSK